MINKNINESFASAIERSEIFKPFLAKDTHQSQQIISGYVNNKRNMPIGKAKVNADYLQDDRFSMKAAAEYFISLLMRDSSDWNSETEVFQTAFQQRKEERDRLKMDQQVLEEILVKPFEKRNSTDNKTVEKYVKEQVEEIGIETLFVFQICENSHINFSKVVGEYNSSLGDRG